jgi:hypothetical protein
MNKITKISAIAVTTAALGLASLTAFAHKGEYGGDGEYGQRHSGQMMGQGMGQGMGMHMGQGKGMHMGQGMGRDLDLSADEVKTLIEARMIMHGNDLLKVGKVSQKDDQTYLVDIVTVDDSLVRQIEVDRNKGFRHGMNRLNK